MASPDHSRSLGIGRQFATAAQKQWAVLFGRTTRSAARVFLALSWFLLLSTPALAHKLYVFSYVEGRAIHGTAYFRGGDPGPASEGDTGWLRG